MGQILSFFYILLGLCSILSILIFYRIMMATSYGLNQFWNKKQNSDFMITTPRSLDVYFGKSHDKISIGHLSICKQINGVSSDVSISMNQDSIASVLCKKLRGVKLCPNQQTALQKPIYFIDKNTTHNFTLTLDEIFNHFINYSIDLYTKATISTKMKENIIRPFLKIYWFMQNNPMEISSKQASVIRDLYKIFRSVLNDKEKDQLQEHEVQEEELTSRNTKVIEEANKIMQVLQKSEQDQSNKDDDQRSKMATNYFLKSFKSIHAGTTRNMNTGHSIRTQKIIQTTKVLPRTAKKIKFKNIHTANNDDSELSEDDAEDLCYELGLLIQDIDRILKPADPDVLS